MPPNLDVIGAIEVAYDTTLSESDWVERIAQTVSPAFGAGVAPTTVYLFDFGAPKPVPIGSFASVGPGAFTREHFVNMQVVATPAELRQSYECEMFTLLSRVVGRPRTTEAIKSSDMHATGAMDPLGLRANITCDSGVIITTLVPLGFRIQQRTLWTRLASHIGAGARLRSAQRSPTTAAAILTPSGKLEHATNATAAARSALTESVKRMDRARGRLRRTDPDEASSLWRAMVSGEWSLVDWFDHDGKRFLLAHENAVSPKRTRQLSPREHQVVACAAMGHSNKLIAYDLGLSTGTVGVMISRAASKLGVASRAELIRAFRELAPATPNHG